MLSSILNELMGFMVMLRGGGEIIILLEADYCPWQIVRLNEVRCFLKTVIPAQARIPPERLGYRQLVTIINTKSVVHIFGLSAREQYQISICWYLHFLSIKSRKYYL